MDTVLAEAIEFADDVTELLQFSLPDSPEMDVTETGDRVKISPLGQTERAGGIPLKINDEVLAWLRIDYLCRLDSSQTYMAIDSSKMWIVADVDSTPIIRFEYLYEADWVPHSHIQVHGERGALSHLLTKTERKKPHDMSALHLPTGGARFRPSLEDIVQFLVVDCKFDRLVSWHEVVDKHREKWRRKQTRAAVRSMAEEAANELIELGYAVEPPEGGHPKTGTKARRTW